MTGLKAYVIAATVAGTLLSGAAAALMAMTDPYAALPQLSARHPAADYRTLAGAPAGSAMQVYLVTAAVFTACYLTAGLYARRRARKAAPPPEREQGAGP